MIDGVVIETAVYGRAARLWCCERDGANGGLTGREAHVFVPVTGELPAPGDDLWWRDGRVAWFPQDGRFRSRDLMLTALEVVA